MEYIQAFARVLPVLLLILLGVILGRKKFIRRDTVEDIKKLVINLTLPAVLFLAFSRVELESRHLLVVALVFLACLLALGAARLLQPAGRGGSAYFPMLMTGFEAGMLGYALFGSVFGQEQIVKFGIVDLGQVTFVFFVLVTALQRVTAGARPFSETLLGFFKTPVILAILLGVLSSRTGVTALLASRPISASLLDTLDLLAALTTPLVALVIGCEMRLVKGSLARSLPAVALRLLYWVPVGLLFNFLVIDRLLHLDPVFQAAVMTMVILPPPFVIPLFMHGAEEDEQAFVVNSLSLSTLVTLFAFAAISLIYR